ALKLVTATAAEGGGDGDQFPDIAWVRLTMESRSASAPGDVDHGGGISGSGVLLLRSLAGSASTASASRSMVSVTHRGGRSPATRSAAAASAIWWLTLRIA